MVRIPRFPRPPKKIQQRQLVIRAQLWPKLNPSELWSRHTHDGFSTIPSTITLIMSILDDLAGQPVSSIYLDLWTRAYDESFVALSKPREFAFHAGFTSQRAERTWKQKLRILKDIHFIDLKSGSSGPESYALIRNPYLVIQWHHERRTPGLREDKFNALVTRALEIGDKTFAPAPAVTTTTPAAAPRAASTIATATPTAPETSAVRASSYARPASGASAPAGSVPSKKRVSASRPV